jgi:hypothetical protein
MKKYLKYLHPDFIIMFLWFIILQPLLFFMTMFVFFYAIYHSIWG